jgi:hypothetical protein
VSQATAQQPSAVVAIVAVCTCGDSLYLTRPLIRRQHYCGPGYTHVGRTWLVASRPV